MYGSRRHRSCSSPPTRFKEALDPQPRESLDPVQPGDSCLNEDHPADHATEDHLSSQGFILSLSVVVVMPERPPAVVASTPEDVLRDLEMSEDDNRAGNAIEDTEFSDDDDEDTLDSAPSGSAAHPEAHPLATAVKRPKRLQRRPAKIAAPVSAPAQKPMMPIIVLSRRKHASQSGPSSTIVRRTPRLTTPPRESLRFFRLMCGDLVHARKNIFLISDLIFA